MTGDSKRLKERVRQRMAERRIKDLNDLSTISGVPVRTINNILAGRRSRSRYAVEIALDWIAGSIETVLAGGEATSRPDSVGPDDKGVFVSHRAPSPLEAVEAAREATRKMDEALAVLAQTLAEQNPEAIR